MTEAFARPILVTGAAGLLGRAVVEHVVEAGERVVALDREAVTPPAGVEFIADDLGSRERLEAICSGLAGIVHCAAYAHAHSAREDILFAGNVTSTANLLFAAEAAEVPRLIYASSQSALGFAYAPDIVAPTRVPVDENEPSRPREGYALSKLVGEQICEMISRRSPMVTRALRFPVIWHPDRFAEHTAKRLGDPKQAAKSQWAYVDVRDAARACRLALLDPGPARFAVYNIAAPWPFACDDAERRLGEAYGAAPRREGWRPGEAVYDSSRAANELGFRARWRWTPEGIADS